MNGSAYTPPQAGLSFELCLLSARLQVKIFARRVLVASLIEKEGAKAAYCIRLASKVPAFLISGTLLLRLR